MCVRLFPGQPTAFHCPGWLPLQFSCQLILTPPTKAKRHEIVQRSVVICQVMEHADMTGHAPMFIDLHSGIDLPLCTVQHPNGLGVDWATPIQANIVGHFTVYFCIEICH